ncbi:unnamed protein product [Camellia sinensis]
MIGHSKLPFWQNKWPTGNKECRPAIYIADGIKSLAGGLKPWPVMCGDASQGIPCPSKAFPAPPRQNTSVWCKTRHNTVESRGPEARRATETSGNSRQTQTRVITKCSNGDIQVLRTVKNGVSTKTHPLLCFKVVSMLASVESMMPLHSAIASARLRSNIAVDSSCWSLLSEDFALPRLSVQKHRLDKESKAENPLPFCRGQFETSTITDLLTVAQPTCFQTTANGCDVLQHTISGV